MKTININLIGDLDKVPEYNKAVIQKDYIDARTKIYLIVFIIGVFAVLTINFGLWFVTNNLCGKYRPEVKNLKNEHQKLAKQQTELVIYRKNIQDDLKLAEFKMLVKKQINSSYIPWSGVLKDLAAKVPRDIVILDIGKATAYRASGQINKLAISGIVPTYQTVVDYKKLRIKPLTAVSFLILNINEDPNSLLSNAEIKRIEYKKESGVYEFEITANVRTLKEQKAVNVVNVLKNRKRSHE